MNFDNYKFRAHMVGKIITLPKPLTERQAETLEAYRDRANGVGKPLTDKQQKDWHSLEHKENESKIYKLTEGAKKELTELVMFEKFGRKAKIETKYFTKGLECEKKARDLLGKVLGTYLTADNERKTNEWVTGKRDIKHDELIIDIKTSFSFKTFNQHLVDSVSETYLRQLDCYMELWGVKDSLLAFVLVDTPSKLIEDELWRLNYRDDVFTLDGAVKDNKIDVVKELVCEHIYTEKGIEEFCNQSASIQLEWFDDFKEIPEEQRVHLVTHTFNTERIEQRNECIKLAREYMNSVKVFNNLTVKDRLFL